jgi:hypothetical protein
MLIHLTNTKGDVVVIDTTTQDFNVFLGAADPENVDPVDPLNPEEDEDNPSPRTTTELEIYALMEGGFFKRSKTIGMITNALNHGEEGHSKTDISDAVNFFLLNYPDDLAVRKNRGATIYFDPVELDLVKTEKARKVFLTPTDE